MADLTTLLSKFLTSWYVGTVPLTGVAFAALPAAPVAGTLAYVTDSNTATWGATVAGGGANVVLVVFNGSVWTVVGK